MTQSPCINVCALEDGECVGCGRTMAEITNWKQMSDEEKQAIIERINSAESS